MTGVSTDFRLVTQVTDLRARAVVQRVDNSAGYRPRVVTYTSVDAREWFVKSWPGAVTVIVFGGLLAAVTGIVVRFGIRRRRSIADPSGPAAV